MSNLWFDKRYPGMDDIIRKAKKKIPKFAFEYLDGGCNEDVNLVKNTSEIRELELIPKYLSKHTASNLKTELFGHLYDAPFGIAPVGLQGLMWPGSPEILAKASLKHNIPFILSTVTTMNIEKACELTEGRSWFQLYYPTEQSMREDILNRTREAGCPVLVLLSDVPVFGFRPRDIRNGLAMPPSMSLSNIIQIMKRPGWAMRTLKIGRPEFKNLTPYIPEGLPLKDLGELMNEKFSGRLNPEKITRIRDMWKGKLVIKGLASDEDVEKAISLGVDGVIVSNHGGRQLDAGQSTIKPLKSIAEKYSGRIKIMMDSGIRTGPDIARTLARGAEFAFLGRSFMYSVAALGDKGGDHMIGLLKTQLQQVMEQICCEEIRDLPDFLAT